jgi:hypothetical protein
MCGLSHVEGTILQNHSSDPKYQQGTVKTNLVTSTDCK